MDLPFDPAAGESIAVSGVCLTWNRTHFDVVPETLSRTTLGRLHRGDRVNLERALRAGERLGGNFVTGHVDAVGSVVELRRVRKGRELWV